MFRGPLLFIGIILTGCGGLTAAGRGVEVGKVKPAAQCEPSHESVGKVAVCNCKQTGTQGAATLERLREDEERLRNSFGSTNKTNYLYESETPDARGRFTWEAYACPWQGNSAPAP